MNTNLGSIELTDDQRDALANQIDGKETARLATRKEIVAIAQRHLGGVARAAESDTFEDVYEEDTEQAAFDPKGPLYTVDTSDPLTRTMAKPDDPSYVRGWNQVRGK